MIFDQNTNIARIRKYEDALKCNKKSRLNLNQEAYKFAISYVRNSKEDCNYIL